MTVKPVNPVAEKEAKYLAAEVREADPTITKVFWFPDDQEVRLVEITEDVSANLEDELFPFYFQASPQHELPLPSAAVMIRPEEVGKFSPPKGWGSWSDAVEL